MANCDVLIRIMRRIIIIAKLAAFYIEEIEPLEPLLWFKNIGKCNKISFDTGKEALRIPSALP